MPQIKSPQDLFAGLFTEATPEGLPQGASPRAINVDYIVGSVGPRPGKQSAFTYDDTFFESTAPFTDSVGTGAPWSAGSVTLNQAAGGNPVRWAPLMQVVGNPTPNSIEYSRLAGSDISGPCVMLLPMWMSANVGGGGSGDDGELLSVSDTAGGSWVQLQSKISFLQSDPPPITPDPALFKSFQFWAGYFPGGFPASVHITLTFNLPLSGGFSGISPSGTNLAAFGVYENCTEVFQFAFQKFAPTTSQFNGVPITTNADAFIVSVSNLPNPASITAGFAISPRGSVLGIPISGAYLTGGSPTFNQPPGTYNPQWGYGSVPVLPFQDTIVMTMALRTLVGAATGDTSQTLQALNFDLAIPVDIPEQGQVAAGCGETYHFVTPPTTIPVFGVEVKITGSQSNLSPDAMLQVQLQLPDGTLSPETKTTQLPLTIGTVTLGSPTDLWGFTADELTVALLNDPNFTVNIVAVAPNGETVTFNITVTVLVAFTTPDPPPDINYLKTFKGTGGELSSLVLGGNGTLYLEDVINAPDVLTPYFTRIFPNNFAQSATLDNREYIAFSNLRNGTDIPRVYTPPSGETPSSFDRLSQVGPGASPSAIGSTAGGVINIVSITQPTQKDDPEAPGHLSGVLWSAGPGSTAPGNVITVYYGRSDPPGPLTQGDPDLVVGSGVFVFVDGSQPNGQFNGQVIDGDYIITSVGEGVPPGADFGRWYFTVQAPVTQFVNQADHIEGNGPVGFYQVETATLTAASQVPNLEVGGSMQIAGTGGSPPAGYDGTWTVTVALNAAQLQITSTERTANQAVYGYILISGSNPTVGQQITVGGTLNGGGVFNVQNLGITAASPGTFTISLPGPDVSNAAENGTGVIFGTQFKFEPNKIVGNKTGGIITVAGIFSSGIRKVCYSFLTRNGFLTQPSPIFTADVTIGSTGIAVSNLAVGPENVIARVVHFTAANGGQFYNIPDPVVIIDPITGLTTTHTSTWVMDNTSTQATFSFSDVVLLAADEIDIQGNNLFACYELGSCQQLVPYAQRLAAVGEQNKVFNFRNYSFDGGVGGQSSGQTYPLGWTVDGTNGAGGSVVTSPIFGWAYQIANATGSPQAIYGMITQPAYKDEFMADIIGASTTYSVRVTVAALATIASGNLVIDLFSASLARVLGAYTLPLSSLTTTMQLLSGTLLTDDLAPVPQDLVIRIYATNIPDGATVILDREEVFPTEQPNLDTQVIFSYGDNFEAFDRLTGVIKPSQNSQPIKSCFVEFDSFYMGKTNSLLSTADNGTTEPVVAGGGWNVRSVSQSVGTTSIYGITTAIDEPNSGEDWAIVVGRAGCYIYDGGEPVKLSEEIQSIWNQINWEFGHTLWVLNDIVNRRILVGVPLRTFWHDPYGNVVRGNWLPEGVIPDDPSPTTPNVVLELNYKQLNTANALSSSVGVHRSYSGKLLASEITRKWALWTIKAPTAAFLQRADNTTPVFVGNSDHNGKVFQLVEGLLEDDGSPFSERYVTSPFLGRQDAQGQGVGVLRCGYDYMTLIIDGMGSVKIRVYPNALDSPYVHDLLPDLEFPLMSNGDAELPVDEEASRLFVEFICQCINSAYTLSGMVMVMNTSGYAPYRGRNN